MKKYLEISKEFKDINESALELLIDKLYDLGIEGIEIKSPLYKEEINGDYFDEKILEDASTTIKAYIKEEIYIENQRKIDEVLIKYLVEPVEDQEKWLLAYQKYFKVFKPGKKFIIVPEWESYDKREDELVIKINPNTAFGTGTHPTTKNVLLLMEELDFRDKKVADIGAGSGILTKASLLLKAKSVTVVDNDKKALKVAKDNLKEYNNITYRLNNLMDGMLDKFDIILANIVADVLIDLGKDINKNLEAEAKIIISGIIKEKWDKVALSFKRQELNLLKVMEEEGWITALYGK